jgi:hypothetical protein
MTKIFWASPCTPIQREKEGGEEREEGSMQVSLRKVIKFAAVNSHLLYIFTNKEIHCFNWVIIKH